MADLTPQQLEALKTPIRVPPGHGLRVVPFEERLERMSQDFLLEAAAPFNTLLVWEPPRKGQKYVLTADVSSGLELDNSVIEVTRVGTLREGAEQVAQFVSPNTDETDLAHIIDAVGNFYRGNDDLPALVAIECNGMGIATQNELHKHIGYSNIFIWRYLDAVQGEGLTTRYGWYTNQRTRPLILQRYLREIKTVDKYTGVPDYRINSPHTIHEMASFQSLGPLWMAEAVDGAHDDCIMAGAIGVWIASTVMIENQGETVHDARRRMSEETARLQQKQETLERKITPQTTDVSYDAVMGRDSWDEWYPEEHII